MASENKTTPPATPVKGPSLSDTQCRDNLIAAALREIVRHQVAENKYNAAMAGTWAVRFANETMVARAAETAPLNLVVARSAALILNTDDGAALKPDGSVELPPKTISEIIGDAEPVEEVK